MQKFKNNEARPKFTGSYKKKKRVESIEHTHNLITSRLYWLFTNLPALCVHQLLITYLSLNQELQLTVIDPSHALAQKTAPEHKTFENLGVI